MADDLDLDPDVPAGRGILRWVRDALLAVVIAFVAFSVFARAQAPDLPDEAPAFTLLDLDGQEVQLADLRGQTVVLNFWATWCGPCRTEAPTFDAFSRAHPDLTVVGVVADGPAAKVRSVAKELGITYPVVMADPATLAAYGVHTFPTTVIVKPDGQIRWAHTGIMLRPQLAWAAGKLW